MILVRACALPAGVRDTGQSMRPVAVCERYWPLDLPRSQVLLIEEAEPEFPSYPAALPLTEGTEAFQNLPPQLCSPSIWSSGSVVWLGFTHFFFFFILQTFLCIEKNRK